MRNQDQLKRNTDDNLNYRKTKSEVDQLTCEFELLEEKAISFGTMSGIEADLKRLFQENDRLLSEYRTGTGQFIDTREEVLVNGDPNQQQQSQGQKRDLVEKKRKITGA